MGVKRQVSVLSLFSSRIGNGKASGVTWAQQVSLYLHLCPDNLITFGYRIAACLVMVEQLSNSLASRLHQPPYVRPRVAWPVRRHQRRHSWQLCLHRHITDQSLTHPEPPHGQLELDTTTTKPINTTLLFTSISGVNAPNTVQRAPDHFHQDRGCTCAPVRQGPPESGSFSVQQPHPRASGCRQTPSFRNADIESKLRPPSATTRLLSNFSLSHLPFSTAVNKA